MPADTKATEYRWFMTMNEDDAIVRFVWKPIGEFMSSMTLGELEFQVFDQTDESIWETKRTFELPWVVAQSVARREGFAVEVPVYDAGA